MNRAYRDPTPTPLGALVREHGWHMTRHLFVVVAIFLGLPLFVVLALPSGEPMSDWSLGTWIGAVLFLSMPVLGVYILVTALKQRSNFVRVHELGFVHRWKGVETTVHYEHVRDVDTRTVETRSGNTYDTHTIRTDEGKTLIVTQGYDEAASLVAEIRERVVRAKAERSAR